MAHLVCFGISNKSFCNHFEEVEEGRIEKTTKNM